MSFSGDIKNHLLNTDIKSICCARQELTVLSLFYPGKMIKTDNPVIKNRVCYLVNKAEHREPSVTESVKRGKKIFEIDFGGEEDQQSGELMLPGNDCCKKTAVRTAFILCGTVNSPDSKYSRIEFSFENQELFEYITSLISFFGIDMNRAERFGKTVAYCTKNESVSDILTVIGANREKLLFDNSIVEKEVNNNVNRVMNCDNRNLNKIIQTCEKQITAIRALRRAGYFDELPDNLKQTALMREKYPEYSIKDLAEVHEPKVSRSCLIHRLEKIQNEAKKFL